MPPTETHPLHVPHDSVDHSHDHISAEASLSTVVDKVRYSLFERKKNDQLTMIFDPQTEISNASMMTKAVPTTKSQHIDHKTKRGLNRRNYVQLFRMDDNDGNVGSDADVEEITPQSIIAETTTTAPIVDASTTADITDAQTEASENHETIVTIPTTSSNEITHTDANIVTTTAVPAVGGTGTDEGYYYGGSPLSGANLIYITTTDEPQPSEPASNGAGGFQPSIQYDYPNYYHYDAGRHFVPILGFRPF